jgi:hypothetical protein
MSGERAKGVSQQKGTYKDRAVVCEKVQKKKKRLYEAIEMCADPAARGRCCSCQRGNLRVDPARGQRV